MRRPVSGGGMCGWRAGRGARCRERTPARPLSSPSRFHLYLIDGPVGGVDSGTAAVIHACSGVPGEGQRKEHTSHNGWQGHGRPLMRTRITRRSPTALDAPVFCQRSTQSPALHPESVSTQRPSPTLGQIDAVHQALSRDHRRVVAGDWVAGGDGVGGGAAVVRRGRGISALAAQQAGLATPHAPAPRRAPSAPPALTSRAPSRWPASGLPGG